jgi:hypothetical protein
MTRMGRTVSLAVVGILGLSGAACSIDVREHPSGRDGDVEIRTPLGGMSVKSNPLPDTGLPVYPGAQPFRERDEDDNASVSIDSWLFDLDVAAAKFRTPATPEQVVEFYRNEMATFGDVLECRGDIDFKGRDGHQHAVCDKKFLERDTQLVVGSGNNHRMVVVKPRASGAQFSIVRIQTDVRH